MVRKKLVRYSANASDKLIIQPEKSQSDEIKQQWEEIFGNKNPMVLELACGKGEYTVGMGKKFLDKNFVGIDVKGNRLRYGADEAKKLQLTNVAFLRAIIQNLEQFFAPASVEEIRIIHPDPRPKNFDAKRRLTHPRFLAMYKNILQSGGKIKLKTDDAPLFEYSKEMFEKEGWQLISFTNDLYTSPLLEEHFGIITHYEAKFTGKGRKICYGIWQKKLDY